MTQRAADRLPASVLLFYALPAFVVALPTIPVYIHLPALYGLELGLGLATTGLVLLLARGFDTVTDPLVGILSDRVSFRGAYRKPWIAVGAAVAGFGLFRLLNPPDDPGAAYLLGWSVVLYGGWTLVAVPYTAWGAELSRDYDERTRITAWRESFSLLAIVGAGALTAAVTTLGGTERESVAVIAWAAIGMGLVFVPLLLWRVPEAAPEASRTTRFDLRSLRALIANRPFLRLISAWFLNGLANGVPAALFFVYLEHGLGAGEKERPLFVLAYFLAAIVSIPLWRSLSRRFGKHRAWCWAMLLACLAFAVVPLLGAGQYLAFGAVCLITGMALGADLVLPPSIQADVVDYHALRGGRPETGLQFALWSMSTKLALALAVGLALPGVTLFGFDPDAPTAQGLWALGVTYAWVPIAIKAMAIAAIWRFPLTAARHAVIRRRLSGRRSAADQPREVPA